MNKSSYFAFLIVSVILTMASCKSSEKDILILTTDNFVGETSKGIVMVDFWATWCMPCKAMSPIIDEIASQTKGKVKVGKVDIDKNGPLANRFGIQSIPTVMIFKDGQLMETLVGVQSKAALVNVLSKYVTLE
jgi:thioredoxin 1